MSSSDDDSSSSSEDERRSQGEKETIQNEGSSEDSESEEEQQRGGGLRPFSSGSQQKAKDSDSDSNSESDQSEEEEEKPGEELIVGEILQNIGEELQEEIENEDMSSLLESDAVFRLIQEQFNNPTGEEVDSYEGGYIDDEINVENDDSFDFGEESEENNNKKRSSALLYLDPEEQDPFLIGKSNRPWKKPAIGKIEPSDIIERVKQFLPQFEAANEELQAQTDAGINFDIEQLQDENQQYIEMNLALGIMDEEVEVKSPENKKLIEML